jgi:hypothetical protein
MNPKKTKSEKREKKRKRKMPVSGKSVLVIKKIIDEKTKKDKNSPE